MAYAANTEVPFERSVSEIIGLLRKAGADDIGQMESRSNFRLQFTLADRTIQFRVQLPTADQIETMTGPRQDPVRVAEQWRRQRGRALLLVIKAKLESVESEVETFEQAFLANVLLSNGDTVFDRVREPVALEYKSRAVQPMMLEGPRRG